MIPFLRSAILTAMTLVWTGLVPSAQAQWGSIRANNHERREAVEHAPVRHEEIEHARPRAINEPRHWDLDIDRHHGEFWWGYHPGMVTAALPPGYAYVNLGGRPYYYYQGVYYQPATSGYVVVVPPAGAIVPALPPGAEAVGANGTFYYYGGGAFYQQQPNGYLVVPPPLGVSVPSLPPGAVPVTINGMLYYQAGNVFFLPVMQGGITVYTVVQP